MRGLSHGEAQDLLDTFKRGWETRDPEVVVGLFREDAEYRAHPFSEPLVGSIAIRAHWNEIAAMQGHIDFEPERIWVSGSTVLASWHAAYTRRATAERYRLRGFMTLELDEDGAVWRYRQWPHEQLVGIDSSFRAEGEAGV
jgi:ketosteroid isomerase-like protein